MVNAVGEAMRQAMEADPSVIVIGEDVVGGAGRGGTKENTMGGSFGATKSLFPLFGAEPCPRHADLGGRLRRSGGRCRRGRAAAGGRRDVGRFHRARVRPDLQPGGEDVVHVRRAGAAAADDSRRDGLRSQRRGAALRHAVLDLHAPPGAQGGRAVDAVRRQRAAARGDLRRQPGALLRAPQAVRRAGPRAGGAVPDPARRRRGSPHRQRRHHRRHLGDGAAGARGGRAARRRRRSARR